MNKYQWISVKDRLPDDYDMKLVTDGKEYWLCYYMIGQERWEMDEFIEDYDGEFNTQNITHWAELIELPDNK